MKGFYALFNRLDAPYRRWRHKRIWQSTRRSLESRPALQETFLMIHHLIWRDGEYRKVAREEIFSALKIKGEVYEKRFSDLRKTLKNRL